MSEILPDPKIRLESNENRTEETWKHSTPCALPRMYIRGRVGVKIKLALDFVEGKRLLPIVKIERV